MTGQRLLLDHAYRWERTTPDDVWLIQPVGHGEMKTYTWSQALDEARRMAAHIQSFRFTPASQIAILSKNCAEFIIADLAIWMAGHASVAVYPTLNADTVGFILEHSESKLVFVGKLDDWPTMRTGVPEHLPRIAFTLAPKTDYEKWSDIVARTEPIAGSPTRGANELATIIYTSGSTGRPKGVMHSFRSMTRAAQALNERFGMSSEDRCLSYLPLAHAMERWLLESQGFIAGFKIFFTKSPDTFVQDIQRARPTVFVSVPRLWSKFQLGVHQEVPPEQLNRLLKIPIVSRIVKKKILAVLGLDAVRFAVSGSAPIPAELVQWYRDLGLELLEGYGTTEDFACSHTSELGQGRVGYVGAPYPGVQVRISEEGEILIKSPGNMMGYFKEPELTAACYTEDGFFRTGDRGEQDSEGRLKVTGRIKELFKTGKGKYIAPAPIENVLNVNPNVELSCVSGSGRPQPFAVVALAEDLHDRVEDLETRQRVHGELQALLAEVNRKVEQHEQLEFIAIPKEPWLIENGFLTPTMKIRRARVEEAYEPLVNAWYASGTRVIWEGWSHPERLDPLEVRSDPSSALGTR